MKTIALTVANITKGTVLHYEAARRVSVGAIDEIGGEVIVMILGLS